jgi:hypothetical protein
LVLVGAYCRGCLARASTGVELEEAMIDLQLARIGWQHADPSFRRVFASQFLPDSSPGRYGMPSTILTAHEPAWPVFLTEVDRLLTECS